MPSSLVEVSTAPTQKANAKTAAVAQSNVGAKVHVNANATANATANTTANVTANATAKLVKLKKPVSMKDVLDQAKAGGLAKAKAKKQVKVQQGEIWNGKRHSDPPTAKSVKVGGIHPTRAFIEVSETHSKKPHHKHSKKAKALVGVDKSGAGPTTSSTEAPLVKTVGAGADVQTAPPPTSDLVKQNHTKESTSAGGEGTQKHSKHHKKHGHKGKSRLVRAEQK